MAVHHPLAAFLLALLSSFAHAEPNDLTTREILSIINERDRHYIQRFDGQEKAVAAALAAAKEAVIKAEGASEKRFDSVNEFRNTLKDQQQTLLPRGEALIRFKSTEDKLAIIEAWQNSASGRSDGFMWLWGLLVGAGGLVAGLVIAVTGVFRTRPIKP